MSRSNQLAGLITATPSTALDTINEINTSLNNDANLSTTLTNSIATKASKSGDTFTGNVGVGVAPSDQGTGRSHLHIHSSSTDYSYLSLTNNTSGSDATANGTNILSDGNNFKILNRESGGDITLQTTGAGDVVMPNGNVGIGTVSPTSVLTVKSDTANDLANGIRFEGHNSTNTPVLIYENGTGEGVLELFDDSTKKARFRTRGSSFFNGGNVGIGLTTPTHTLDVYSTQTASFSLDRNTASNASNLGEYNTFYSLSIKNRTNGSYLRFGGGGSRTEIQATDGASTPTAKNITLNQHGGNVGIGCIPDADFQVGDAGKNIGLNIEGVFDSPLDSSNNPTIGGVRIRGGRFQSGMNNNSTAVKIYDAGMGSGRSSGNFSCGIGFMHLDSNNWSTGNSTNYPGMHAWIGLQLVDTPGQERSSLTIGTTNGTSAGSMPGQRITFSPNGNIGAPTGSGIYGGSDIRFKQNIVNLEGALSKINQIQGVSFNWKEGYEPDEDGKTLYGFIAQDVEVVDSTLVEYFANGHTVEIGDEKIENPLRVNEKFIIPMLVEAVKELSGKVTALESAS